jgi:transcriptional regulator with XRE-family HTH domain
MATKKSHPRTSGPADAKLGEKIRIRRTAAGMSQSELGESLGVSFQQIQKYEKGPTGSARSDWSRSRRRLTKAYLISRPTDTASARPDRSCKP